MNASAPARSPDPLDSLPVVASKFIRSQSSFEELVAAGAPAVLHGLIDDWPALRAGRQSPATLDDYFKERDCGAPVPVMEAPPATGGRLGYASDVREFSFTKRSRPLAETLERIARARSGHATGYLAIQMLPLDTHMPAFARENPMPFLPADARPRLWLGDAVKTQIHNDQDHNLACVIAGRRRFVLFPPEQLANLYIGPLDNPPPLSLVDAEAPDVARFPRFRDALKAAQVAYLEPGDALFLPRYWWHHVTSRDPYNAMINYWWGNSAPGLGNPYDAFLTALLAYKTLPTRQRLYWAAMFEAHVFGDEGTKHIPAAVRGMVGAMTPRLRASLKQRLKTAIIKS